MNSKTIQKYFKWNWLSPFIHSFIILSSPSHASGMHISRQIATEKVLRFLGKHKMKWNTVCSSRNDRQTASFSSRSSITTIQSSLNSNTSSRGLRHSWQCITIAVFYDAAPYSLDISIGVWESRVRLRHSRLMKQVPLKRALTVKLHGVTFQKTAIVWYTLLPCN
jgi:hypothetical protein